MLNRRNLLYLAVIMISLVINQFVVTFSVVCQNEHIFPIDSTTKNCIESNVPIQWVVNPGFEDDPIDVIPPPYNLTGWITGAQYEKELSIQLGKFVQIVNGKSVNVATIDDYDTFYQYKPFNFNESSLYQFSGALRLVAAERASWMSQVSIIISFTNATHDELGFLYFYIDESWSYTNFTTHPQYFELYYNLSPYRKNFWPTNDSGWQYFNCPLNEQLKGHPSMNTAVKRQQIKYYQISFTLYANYNQKSSGSFDNISFLEYPNYYPVTITSATSNDELVKKLFDALLVGIIPGTVIAGSTIAYRFTHKQHSKKFEKIDKKDEITIKGSRDYIKKLED